MPRRRAAADTLRRVEHQPASHSAPEERAADVPHCQRHVTYLKDVLARLPSQQYSRIGELLPHRWTPLGTCWPTPSRRVRRALTEYFHLAALNSLGALEAAVHDYIRYDNHEQIKLGLQGHSPAEYRLRNAV